jgi:serine/threonine protein kinase
MSIEAQSQDSSARVGGLIGQYRIKRLLGEGSMGIVYEGSREDIGVRAAIKVLRSEYARREDIAARFINEARAVNRIHHAGIVRIFDYGRLTDGGAYLAMEFLEGETLRARISRTGRLPPPESIRLVRQITAALSAAHAKGIIHRDLKPDNVFIVPDSEALGGERTKVLDFGIAKLTSQTLSRTHKNAFLGTPIYAAPEQCYGAADVTDRADVYSLGIMLYEMLSGAPPFFGESAGDIIASHMFTAPAPLKTKSPDLDLSICQLVDETLLKEPAQRPTMSALEQRLRALKGMFGEAPSISGMSSPLQLPPIAAGSNAATLTSASQRSEDPTKVVSESSLRAYLEPPLPSIRDVPAPPSIKKGLPAWVVLLSCFAVAIAISALMLSLW